MNWINGWCYGFVEYKPFKEWISNKYRSYDEFMKLSKSDRNKIFLRWKWRTEDDKTCEDLEATRRHLLRDMLECDIDAKFPEESDRHFYKNRVEFEKECINIKKSIGLIVDKINDVRITNIVKSVNGVITQTIPREGGRDVQVPKEE